MGTNFQAAVARHEPANEGLAFIARDSRADGAERQVALDRNQVLISRRLEGIAMQVRIKAAAYRGVALGCERDYDGAPHYRIVLEHNDPDLSVMLGENDDGKEILAEWTRWAGFFALPKLFERALEDEPNAGADVIIFGTGKKQRRRGASISRRRPRFLLRRKSGDSTRGETTFAGEREIICYE